MKAHVKAAAKLVLQAAKSKPGRKIEAALIAYAVAELTRRGYLPS